MLPGIIIAAGMQTELIGPAVDHVTQNRAGPLFAPQKDPGPRRHPIHLE